MIARALLVIATLLVTVAPAPALGAYTVVDKDGPATAPRGAPPSPEPQTAFGPATPAAAAAREIAVAYWRGSPCDAKVEEVWMTLAPSVNATATWANPAGQYVQPLDNTECRVTFNSAGSFDWLKFCSVLQHEYGHLAGNPHAQDVADLMAPYYTAPSAECASAVPVPTPVAPLDAAVPVTAAAPASAAKPPRHQRKSSRRKAARDEARRAAKRARAKAGKRAGDPLDDLPWKSLLAVCLYLAGFGVLTWWWLRLRSRAREALVGPSTRPRRMVGRILPWVGVALVVAATFIQVLTLVG